MLVGNVGDSAAMVSLRPTKVCTPQFPLKFSLVYRLQPPPPCFLPTTSLSPSLMSVWLPRLIKDLASTGSSMGSISSRISCMRSECMKCEDMGSVFLPELFSRLIDV